ncbi:hypothetical protein I7I51_01987 [Histoplasma capsulatum]|uniref:Uncharacterized protein n=1 Tax=Ajellomyces capsulatus TaxID=5037 RepID=A0A8A1MK20_AJECA|nr:predicted protein [Histoplasma mississippiense (nom. inval.)]EDN05101.1 predicted protein [Histoplasma mississippiense (nom. inval.)]QSS64912.1 hypothetical protein I7I51_01987 [Histoplasma capsulatum]
MILLSIRKVKIDPNLVIKEGLQNSEGPAIIHLNNQIAQMHYSLYQTTTSAVRDSLLIGRLQGECERLQTLLDESKSNEETYRQQLNQVSAAHSNALHELQAQHGINARLASDLRNARAGEIAAQQAHNAISAELNRVLKRFQYMDSLVDTMRLEEDRSLDPQNRSRQITDIIRDIESRLEAEYQGKLLERDTRIASLEEPVTEEDNTIPRVRSAPPFHLILPAPDASL